MHPLHAFLRDKDIDGVRQVALALGSVLFSVLTVVVMRTVHPTGTWQYVVVFLGAALSLTLIVRTLQRLLLSAWGRPILGRWVYESSSGTWGLARIDIHGGDLRYSVQLYPTEETVLAAVRNDPDAVTACFATVHSAGATYADDRLELVYKIEQTSQAYEPRTGILVLRPLNRRTMKGYWSSDITTGEARRGTLDMRRARYVRAAAKRAADTRPAVLPDAPAAEDEPKPAPAPRGRRTKARSGARNADGAAKATAGAAGNAGKGGDATAVAEADT
ncbi:hypothetical protein [Actinocatenispora rupis]|uniref:Uncharacterized protein n=1 Tax=Actinocatenispora rupis TaxID=519421 RepID=A0A8J3J0F4_9ACTN|nr:hypothetical protein [Actinocatenispora rupis]GID11918.1 hypothetical protein Aru02nite_28070 [Actinocatenispora rupis]